MVPPGPCAPVGERHLDGERVHHEKGNEETLGVPVEPKETFPLLPCNMAFEGLGFPLPTMDRPRLRDPLVDGEDERALRPRVVGDSFVQVRSPARGGHVTRPDGDSGPVLASRQARVGIELHRVAQDEGRIAVQLDLGRVAGGLQEVRPELDLPIAERAVSVVSPALDDAVREARWCAWMAPKKPGVETLLRDLVRQQVIGPSRNDSATIDPASGPLDSSPGTNTKYGRP